MHITPHQHHFPLILTSTLTRTLLLYLFSISSLKVITDLVDSALPSMCHNIQLPCNAQSSDPNEGKKQSPPLSYSDEESAQPTPRAEKDCLSLELLASMLREADRAFCGRYTGAAGGDQATKLSTYAFMKEVSYTYTPLLFTFSSPLLCSPLLTHHVYSLYCILGMWCHCTEYFVVTISSMPNAIVWVTSFSLFSVSLTLLLTYFPTYLPAAILNTIINSSCLTQRFHSDRVASEDSR